MARFKRSFTWKYEIRSIHPHMAKWLDKNGYSHDYEVVLASGRIDFLAVHETTGEKLAIECKPHDRALTKAIAQIKKYANQLDGYTPCLAFHKNGIIQRSRDRIHTEGIHLIELDYKGFTVVEYANRRYDPYENAK